MWHNVAQNVWLNACNTNIYPLYLCIKFINVLVLIHDFKWVVTHCRPNEIHDVAEQQDIASEISDAISDPVGFGEEFDEVTFTEEKYNTLTSYFMKKSPKS